MEFLLEYADEEIWRPVDGYPGYFVSHYGNVQGKDGRILKQRTEQAGYKQIVLHGDKRKAFRTHRLVADAFLLKDESKPYVDHIDRNKNNNRLANLRRATIRENSLNTLSVETSNDLNGKVKLFTAANPSATLSEIANEFKISKRTISKYKRKWTMIEK